MSRKDASENTSEINMAESSIAPPDAEMSDLEQKIRSHSSVPEEDIQEAMALVREHPQLSNQFDYMVRLLPQVVRSDAVQFLQGFQVTTDFMALTGVGKASVEVYLAQREIIGATHLTDEVLEQAVLVKEKCAAVAVVQYLNCFWGNATDRSDKLRVRLAEAQLFPYLAADIKNLGNDFDSENTVFDEEATILYNCAQNKELLQVFRDINLVQILTPLLVRKEQDLKLLVLLTLSYIIDEDDNDLLLADDHDFNFLLAQLANAWSTVDDRELSGYTARELLLGLGNLAKNDNNKKLLMEKGILNQLKPVLKSGNDTEKQEAANIVWELAFDKGNQVQMKNDSELMGLLQTLKDGPHRGVAKPCSGALWVLDMGKKLKEISASPAPSPVPRERPRFQKFSGGRSSRLTATKAAKPSFFADPPGPPAPAPSGGDSQGHVMISYNWGHQKLVMQVRDSLREQGFKVWMDIDNISGSTLQAMAEAVEGASVVLVCMSQRYKDSPNCRTEAEYAFALGKPIVPLLLERGYKADGWLGILKGSKLFFEFSGKYPYQKKVDELVKELGQKGRKDGGAEVDGPSLAEKVRPVASALVTDVALWSQKDVNNWINKSQIKGKTKQNIEGRVKALVESIVTPEEQNEAEEDYMKRVFCLSFDARRR